MTAEKPKIAESSRYSISQAAELLGIHRNTLRQHTEDGIIKCGYRRSNKRRFYTGSEILRYWNSYL